MSSRSCELLSRRGWLSIVSTTLADDFGSGQVTASRCATPSPPTVLEVFEKSGHLPSYEEPDKYVQVVDDFLGRD